MKWCTWHWGEKKHYLQIGSDYRRTSVQGMFKKWLYLSFSVVFRNGLPRAFKHLERSWIKAVCLIHTGRCSHFASVALNPPARRAGLWPAPRTAAGPDGCLLELDHFPCCKVCLWCMCFCVLRCFSCSHTVLPKEHSLGVIFFLLTFLLLCCNFLQFPVFLSCLPPCHICMLCMGRLMAYFTGTCD